MKLTLTILFALTVMPATIAQTSDGFVPVDQAVGDLDPLATSFRRLGTGLRLDGEHTSLFRIDLDTNGPWFSFNSAVAPRSATDQPIYYRIAPGVQALADRIDYAVPAGRRSFKVNVAPSQDGLFFELIHANTIFVLTPPSPPPPTPTVDYRIDGRIDGRLDLRVNGQAQYDSLNR